MLGLHLRPKIIEIVNSLELCIFEEVNLANQNTVFLSIDQSEHSIYPYLAIVSGHQDMFVGEPGMIGAGQSLSLEKSEGFQVPLDEFTHFKNILSRDTHNIPVLNIEEFYCKLPLYDHRRVNCLHIV